METTSVDHSEDYIKPSIFCDSRSEIIHRAALNIVQDSASTREQVVKIFYWVRDSIKYELGLARDKASETLVKGGGSCTNKSNLMVALLRSLGIPAGFHIMEVRTRQYLGALCTPRFNQFMGEKSLHTYCSVNIEGKWVKVDPADDVRLSNAIQHLCFQATKLHFDGEKDARLNLDPSHVISDSGKLLTSVDAVLEKTRRVPTTAVDIMNYYLDFLRDNCIWNNSVDVVENQFFSWLESEHSTLFATYQAISRFDPVGSVLDLGDNPENIRSNSLSGQA